MNNLESTYRQAGSETAMHWLFPEQIEDLETQFNNATEGKCYCFRTIQQEYDLAGGGLSPDLLEFCFADFRKYVVQN